MRPLAPALAALVLAAALTGCTQQALPPATPPPAPDAAPEGLAFRAPVRFDASSFPAQVGTTCTEKTDGDPGCGLDEPSVVVDARGRVFYTAACCFVVSSPVWVSEDEGASFRPLAHPLEDAYGNEGDLSVDAQGNLYYMDIDLTTFGVARWTPDLAAAEYHRRPGELVVDRPWVRGLSEGVVLAVYNTGSDTVAYRSEDHGATFGLLPVARFGSALAGAYADARRGIVGMYGGGAYMESTDAGATWGERAEVEGCGGDASTYALEGAAVDEAGTVWHLRRGCVVPRGAEGAWGAASTAIPEGFDVAYSWIAAGASGGVAVTFYGQPDAATAAARGLDEEAWYVLVSWTADGGRSWTTQTVDPEPVGRGDALGRRLGDFLQVAIGPDGAVHVAYATNPEMDDSATASYARTEPVPALAPSQALVGPFEPPARGSPRALGGAA